MKSLEKDRVSRYESAAGLAIDVERLLHGEAVEAHPPSVSYRLRKFAQRNKLAVAMSLLVTTALVFGLVVTSLGMMVFQRISRDLQAANGQFVQQKHRADEKARIATEARQELEHQSYPLMMMAAFQAWEAADLQRAKELLLDAREFDRLSPKADVAWRFLWERIREGYPESIEVGDRSQCIAFSPDGKHLAVGLATGKVVLYEFATSPTGFEPVTFGSGGRLAMVNPLK